MVNNFPELSSLGCTEIQAHQCKNSINDLTAAFAVKGFGTSPFPIAEPRHEALWITPDLLSEEREVIYIDIIVF